MDAYEKWKIVWEQRWMGAQQQQQYNKATKIYRLNIQSKHDCNYHINAHRGKIYR